MKAVICPVCLGTGKFKQKKCHGCKGKGWVEVNEFNKPVSLPYYPYTYPEPPCPYDPYKVWYESN